MLEALVVGNWFAKSECDQLLVQQLAALPENRLAGILDTIAELDRSLAQHSLPHILKCAQRLDDRSAICCFQGALGLVSLQTCEAALMHAEIS